MLFKTHTRRHAHMRTHTHMHAHTCTHAHVDTCTHTCTQICAHTCMHTRAPPGLPHVPRQSPSPPRHLTSVQLALQGDRGGRGHVVERMDVNAFSPPPQAHWALRGSVSLGHPVGHRVPVPRQAPMWSLAGLTLRDPAEQGQAGGERRLPDLANFPLTPLPLR